MDKETTYSCYEWWRDIWLPGIGAILVPAAIAFCTWWFGTSRYEKNKELKNLSENLNLLISLMFPFWKTLSDLKKSFESIQKNETVVMKLIKDNIDTGKLTFDDICRSLLFENTMKQIDLKNYSLCTLYDKNFLANIKTLQSMNTLLTNMTLHRNEVIKTISICENNDIKLQRCISFILGDSQDMNKFLNITATSIKLINTLYESILKLKLELRGLKLIQLDCSKEMLQDLNWAIDYTKKEGKA